MSRNLSDYEKYQLEWMQENGHSIDELIEQMQHVFENLYEEKENNEIIDIKNTYEVWHDSFGFNDECFMPKDEYEKRRNNLMTRFKNYCRHEAFECKNYIEEYSEGRHLLYSNEWMLRENELYSLGASTFTDEHAEMFRNCTTAAECEDVLRKYFEEHDKDEWMKEIKSKFNVSSDAPIVAIISASNADGRKGTRTEYRLTDKKILNSVFDFETGCRTGTWYVDDVTRELCSIQYSYGGMLHITYRSCKDVEAFNNALFKGENYRQYLSSLGDDVQKIIGFSWDDEKNSEYELEEDDVMEL